MSETWKPVFGYEDCYAVSDLGNFVRTSLTKKKVTPAWRPIVVSVKREGYAFVHLYREKVGAHLLAHRMVWSSFNGPIPAGLQINHLNGNKSDNRLCNLELCSPSLNMKHAYRTLKIASPNNPNYGTKNGSAKLTEEKVAEIIRLYETGEYRQKDIGKMFGVSQRSISLITRRENWRHVSRQP